MKVKPYVKACERDKGKGKAGDQLYFYPPGQQDPSPMYEGLKTNLPYVSGSDWPKYAVHFSIGKAWPVLRGADFTVSGPDELSGLAIPRPLGSLPRSRWVMVHFHRRPEDNLAHNSPL